MKRQASWVALAVWVLVACTPGASGPYSGARNELTDQIETGRLQGEALAMAHLKRGYAYQLDRHYGLALADYDSAVAAAPKLALAYATRAQLQAGLGRLDAALADADEIVILTPDASADGHFLRGQLRLAAGDGAGALGDFEEAARREPANFRAYGARGAALAALGEDERALADLDRAVEMDPGTLGQRTVRSCTRFQAQTTANCTSRLEDISTAEVMEQVFHARGMIWFKRADYARAVADLDRGGYKGDTQVYAALAHYALGECGKANYAFNHYEYQNDADRDPMIAAHRDFIAKTPCADDVLSE